MKPTLALAALFFLALPALANDPPAVQPAAPPKVTITTLAETGPAVLSGSPTTLPLRPVPQSTLTPMPLAAPSAPCATDNCGTMTIAVGSYGAPVGGMTERATVRSRVREVVRSRPVRSLFHRRRGGGCG